MNAMITALENVAEGDIYFNVQDVTSEAGGNLSDDEIGKQRSALAFEKNADANDFPDADQRMWLLKFTHGETVVGMINWYAIHPTSLVSFNVIMSESMNLCLSYKNPSI